MAGFRRDGHNFALLINKGEYVSLTTELEDDSITSHHSTYLFILVTRGKITPCRVTHVCMLLKSTIIEARATCSVPENNAKIFYQNVLFCAIP